MQDKRTKNVLEFVKCIKLSIDQDNKWRVF